MKLIALFVLLGAGSVFGQDPLLTLPQNYRTTFENDSVRVIRVHYGPHQKLPGHDHPKTPTVYVYLSDSGPVAFKHLGAEPFELDRPPAKSGTFRLNAGFIESHEVVNKGDIASDFLRVELKKVPLGVRGLRGRFPPPSEISRQLTKVEFEDTHVKVIRLICEPHKRCDSDSSAHPALQIALADELIKQDAGPERHDT